MPLKAHSGDIPPSPSVKPFPISSIPRFTPKTDILTQNLVKSSKLRQTKPPNCSKHPRKSTPQGTVLNVNFPESMHAGAPIEQTLPRKVHLGSLYESNEEGYFQFQYREGKRLCQHPNSDRSALSPRKCQHQ